MPPQYSAKKVNGQSAYKSARRGEQVALTPKEVEIFDFEVLEKIDKNKFRFSVTCSSGTYIRSLCRDLATLIGTYGSMQCIIRTRCGGFMLKDAFSIEQIEKGDFSIISTEKVFDFSQILLNENEFEKLCNGQKIKINQQDGKYKLFKKDEFLGTGTVEDGLLSFWLRLF